MAPFATQVLSMSYESTPVPDQPKVAPRPTLQSMWRGLRGKCPSCGSGSLFNSYLKIGEHCHQCGEELHHHRADDAPPYFTIFIVGHIVIPLALAVERLWQPEMYVHMVVWLPLTLLLTLLLLPAVKGAVVGLQWALRMHGFEYAASRQFGPHRAQ